jgi:hypothetical protein
MEMKLNLILNQTRLQFWYIKKTETKCFRDLKDSYVDQIRSQNFQEVSKLGPKLPFKIKN